MACLIGLLLLIAATLAGFVALQGLSDRRKIRSALEYRSGRLVRVAPWWTHRRTVKGWRHGRRMRFQWIDPDEQLHDGECEIEETWPLLGGGTFRFLKG